MWLGDYTDEGKEMSDFFDDRDDGPKGQAVIRHPSDMSTRRMSVGRCEECGLPAFEKPTSQAIGVRLGTCCAVADGTGRCLGKRSVEVR